MKPGSCDWLNRYCQGRNATASPRFRIQIWDDDNRQWQTVRDYRTSIRKTSGDYKTGWWGWNDVVLDGRVRVEIRKRYNDDRYRLAADAFRFLWRDLTPSDREIAIALCKASALNEVLEQRRIIAYSEFGKATSQALLGISLGYFTGLGAAKLPAALGTAVTSINGLKSAKSVQQIASIMREVSNAIRHIQNVPRAIDLATNGLTFAENVLDLTDDLVAAGVLGEHEHLYGFYVSLCRYADDTPVDWTTGREDYLRGPRGSGCDWLRVSCVPGYLHYAVRWHP